jgi:hypothetical protein
MFQVRYFCPPGPEMSNSYPTIIDPKLDAMAWVMAGKDSRGADV